MRSAENPLGLDGFEFVEFTSPDPKGLKALFEQLGFVARHMHPSGALTRYTQGSINVIVNEECAGPAAQFREAHGLTFPLLSDESREVLAAYGAFGEKMLYGKKTTGVIRSTFVLDEKGNIEHAFYNVKAKGHVDKLIRDLNL